MFVRQFNSELERIQREKNESSQVKVFLPLAQKNPMHKWAPGPTK